MNTVPLCGAVRAITIGQYKQRKLRKLTKNEDCKEKVAAEKFALRRRTQLQELVSGELRVSGEGHGIG